MKKGQINIYIDMALFILMGLIFMIVLRNGSFQRSIIGLFGVSGMEKVDLCGIISSTLLGSDYMRYGYMVSSQKLNNTYSFFDMDNPLTITDVNAFVERFFYSCDGFRDKVCNSYPDICNMIAFNRIEFYERALLCDENGDECEQTTETCTCTEKYVSFYLGESPIDQNCMAGKSCVNTELINCKIPVYGPEIIVDVEVCTHE